VKKNRGIKRQYQRGMVCAYNGELTKPTKGKW